ncbi:MAG: multicopper oxidase domain-containing protein [Anaerolineae bacterium]|nr:multicopper oxidase domain-containing protein [Anaerolineae bacterium]
MPHYYGPYSNYANSAFTRADVTVDITGDGTGATATASVGADGAITGITITNPGSGYTSAGVNITGPSLSGGAAADALVTSSGAVTAIIVDQGGGGYSAPVVTISSGGATTDATATAYGSVDALTLTNPGSGYTMPTVDFDMPDDPNGTQAKAHVTWITDTGVITITGIVLDSPGSGYATAPNVVIRDGTIFSPLNNRAKSRAEAARELILNAVEEDLSQSEALNSVAASVDATASATLVIQTIAMDTYGAGYTSVPTVGIGDDIGVGNGASATAFTDLGAVTTVTVTTAGSGYITTGGIKKFQDGLPVLCIPTANFAECSDLTTGVANNLGQYIPIGVADTITFSTGNGFDLDADYYVIALVQHREQMNSSLPITGTMNREYVQLETPENASWSRHIPLMNDLQNGTSVPALMPDGSQAYAVDDPHFLGPIIVATKDKPVRIVFYNLLPTGSDGDLFIPVDTTFMGAGMGPMMMMDPVDEGTVLDGVRNPMCGESTRNRMECFAQNRATLHLHGGITPWISDGTPHQWITPANEETGWPQGVSVSEVPDMQNVPGVPDCTAENDGCMTFYYTNQQSARLMFYHDHSWGITRLNVYAGEAAGYLITDDTEKALMAPGGPLAEVGIGIPLVVQDRTYVPGAAQMADQDPTWDYSIWGGEGDLWYEHVYMPAQNPSDPSGLSAFGRWMYGPWFWPPSDSKYPPIDNPYYDPACNLDEPATWQYQSEPFCEPALIPGTPNNSAGMEQFNDTPIVNGTAYPTVTLDPQSYRFRVLNAANDRFWNLQWYVADPSTASADLNGYGDPIGGTEVALNAAELAAAQLDPNIFPTPDTAISPPGPSWIQIGTEGGFLPAPVVLPNQPLTWIIDPTRFDVGLVDQHTLLLGPAERADVIVDFSQFAGQTLILYNDAPAAFPARVGCYDYYTGGPDLSPACAPSTLPGYGPNTRTVMQVKIAATAPAPAFNLGALNAAFKHHADGSGVFESGQNPIIVGQATYNTAYGTSFASAGWCNSPSNPAAQCDGFARISEQGRDTFKFDTLVGQQIGVEIEPKAIHDETNATNFEPFGRMSGNIGVEAVPATPNGQNIILYPFVNPPTELFDATNLPTTDMITPISVGDDGTQIWKITHNGVDTHPIHFHLYDVQVLNRVTWDGIIKPPDANELGWKDTVRVSPLEDTYFAIRPIIPVLPWELVNSVRPLNPMMPLGDTSMFNPTDINGIPTPLIVNQLINFGSEYMLHCHILSHEEMDMMRPVSVAVPPNVPDGLFYSANGRGNNTSLTLTWNDNSINETSFVVQRSDDGGAWVDVGTVLSPLDQPNTHGLRSFTDTTFRMNAITYAYRVVAMNMIGLGGDFPSLSAQSVSDAVLIIYPPTELVATLLVGPQVRLDWRDNTTDETSFVIERATNGGAFAPLATAPASPDVGTVSFVDTTVVLGDTYTYRVAAVTPGGTSGYATVTITVAIPAAPSNLGVTVVQQDNGERAIITWTDNANSEATFTIQWSANADFIPVAVTNTVGVNVQSYTTGNIAQQVWYFRVRANNVLGPSAWVTSPPIQPAVVIANNLAPLVFANGFTNGLAGWAGQVGNVQANAAAAMGGVAGQGLAANMAGAAVAAQAVTLGAQPAYVYDQTPDALGFYLANFYFDPNDAVTGDNPVDIFIGLDAENEPVFGIQFMHTAAAPDTYQIRGWVEAEELDAELEVYTDWVTIANAPQNIQLDWRSKENVDVLFYVDGSIVATLNADTSEYKLDEVRLGPSGVMDDSASGTMYFDEFVSLGAETDMLAIIFFPLITR